VEEEDIEIKKLEVERERLKQRKKEMENLFLEEGKIDKLVFDPEYQAIDARLDEIDKKKVIKKQETNIEEDIADFRSRLKNEVDRMIKEQ
jgi:tetrahydromethanopterin S-methyltransferase subunit G